MRSRFWIPCSANFASANERWHGATTGRAVRRAERIASMSTNNKLYERFVRPLLFSLDPESAHRFTIRLLRGAVYLDPVLRALQFFAPKSQPTTLFGLNFRNPVGLAAGLDKDGVALPAWEALGFGFIEIGTITAQAQPGNPKPRVFRLTGHEALINRLGFNNDGAEAVAARLRYLREHEKLPGVPLGINIGKSRATPIEQATADYLYSFRLLQEFADYVALNVSSPNTPGLRELHESQKLSALVRAIRNEPGAAAKPLMIKISPDLSSAELESLVKVCEENGVAGIIATNTTLDHSAVPRELDQEGGLSGAPLCSKSTALLHEISARSKIPLIACGGICDAESARQKFHAGAKLIQVYTGFVYRGPRLLHEIMNSL
jgi:dihydroorotate dehydrogenase